MSTAELKRTADGLSESERIYLVAYLKAQALIRSSDHRQELARRMREMDAGKALDAGAVREIHQALESKGL